MTPQSTDHLIVGGGVIGLALAYELATTGATVRIVDSGRVGKQTSWAAAGILPAVPAAGHVGRDAFEELRNQSGRMFPDWLGRLSRDSDIDPEYEAHGALHLAGGVAEAASLSVELAEWRELGLEFDQVDANAIVNHEPALAQAIALGRIQAAYRLPGESMLRTPQYLAALIDACRRRGVEIVEEVAITSWQRSGDRFTGAVCQDTLYAADQFCLTAGVWSAAAAEAWNISLDIRPWRGQMLLLESQDPGERILHQILNDGPKYLVPRRDGRILGGSTVEDAGFEAITTERAIQDLEDFAKHWLPQLSTARRVAQWAGLRPGSGDSWPYLGRTPQWENAFVATGHFRSGIFLSPITARIMSQLMRGEKPAVDISDFRLDRK